MIALTDLIKILIIPNLNNVLIKYSLKKANFHISTKKNSRDVVIMISTSNITNENSVVFVNVKRDIIRLLLNLGFDVKNTCVLFKKVDNLLKGVVSYGVYWIEFKNFEFQKRILIYDK